MIDWVMVHSSIAKSIERNQNCHGEAVPKLALSVLGLAEAERRLVESDPWRLYGQSPLHARQAVRLMYSLWWGA